MSPAEADKEKLEFVDLLRGVAILMVVVVHTAVVIPGLPAALADLLRFGQMGVQLFFVASAYTLARSYGRSVGRPLAIRSFYLRRWFRIAPMYYVGILLYLSLRVAKSIAEGGGMRDLHPYTVTHVLANLLFVHGLYPPANNNIVPGGWSIGTEMLFYSIFPALFALATRLRRHAGIVGLGGLIVIAMLANAVVQVIVAGSLTIGMTNNSFAYLNLLNQLPAFLFGLVGYFSLDRTVAKGARWRLATVLALCVLTVGSLLLWHQRVSGWTFVVLPALAGATFYALLTVVGDRAPRWRVIERIGQLSYSVYVVHFLYAWYVVPRIITLMGLSERPVPTLLVSVPLVLGAACATALATDRWIERPGIAAGSRLIERMRTRRSLA